MTSAASKRRCIIFLLYQVIASADAFAVPTPGRICRGPSSLRIARDADDDVERARLLLAKAKAIRDGIPSESNRADRGNSAMHSISDGKRSEFEVPSNSSVLGCNYRLRIDVGREPGTWMDPMWGASGRRIEFTVDVSFPVSMDIGGSAPLEQVSLASDDIAAGLMKSVTTKSNSAFPVYTMNCARYARLKGGFDKMTIRNGGYCIEPSSSASRSSTLRFCLSVEGTNSNDSSYGDVSIPEGNLYFALPYFGIRTMGSSNRKAMVLSTKEGTVTVKQMGWHTGWWREESRIVGVFRAVPLDDDR
ncbi:hypothetical protein ACHAWX_006260 [Stephanocyclus meneghinianus]